jgi:ABC-type multidrug transport system ATPase subunit
MPYDIDVPSTNERDLGVYAERLGKRYGDVVALEDASFHAPAGSVLGLLGHNGAG